MVLHCLCIRGLHAAGHSAGWAYPPWMGMAVGWCRSRTQDPAVLEHSSGEQSQCSSPPRMCGKARTAVLQCWSDAQSRSLQQHMGMAKLLCLTHQPIPVLLPLSCQCIRVNKTINAETKPSTNTPQRFQLCPFKTLISSLARFKHLRI